MALCGLLLSGPTRVYARDQGPVQKIRVLYGHTVVSGVFVEGHGPYTFLVDTGAQSNVISDTLAAELGFKSAYRLKIVTVAGTLLRAAFVASKVELGSARSEDQEFLLSPMDSFRLVSRDIQGVLGQAFLSKFDYLLDLRRRRLKFNGAAPSGGCKVPFGVMQGRMVVATSLGQLVIDSGANVALLRRAAGLPLRDKTNIVTAAGVVEVHVGAVSVQIGGRSFRNITAALAPNGKQEQLDTDGLLPAAVFDSLYVNNSDGYLILDPRR
jgi:predicted aspartyl protease